MESKNLNIFFFENEGGTKESLSRGENDEKRKICSTQYSLVGNASKYDIG